MKKSQKCAIEGSLATSFQQASPQNGIRVEHAGGAKGSQQLEHYKTKLQVWPVSSRLKLTTHSNRKVESPECPVY